MNQERNMITSLERNEMEGSYILYKELLSPFIINVYGWEESFQRKRFFDSYKSEDMFWYEENGIKKAFICRSTSNETYHIHLLLVPKKYQNQGVGKSVMLLLHSEAYAINRDITLSTFKCNVAASSFYKKLGYISYKEEQDFYNLKLQINNS